MTESIQSNSPHADPLVIENEKLKAELAAANSLNADLKEKLVVAEGNTARTAGFVKTLQTIEYNMAKQREMLVMEVNRLNIELHERDSTWQVQQLPLPARLIQDLQLEDVAVAATASRFGAEAEVDKPCYICNGTGHMSDGKWIHPFH